MLNAERPLTEADRGLSLLSLITRHDPLNTLTVMGMLVELMADDMDTPCGESDYLEKLRQSIGDMTAHMRFTRNYQDLGTHASQWQNLKDVVAEVVGQHSFEVTVDDTVGDHEVFADPMLPMVFRNILDNAERHGGGVTEMRVSVKEKGGVLQLSFSDDGMGIGDNEKESVFQQGFGRNNGLGLFLSREILAITDMSIEEVGQEGANFLISVPLTSHRPRASDKDVLC